MLFRSLFLVLFHIIMELLTDALLKQFSEVGNQSEVEDPWVICTFFHPFCAWTRYATEYDPENRLFFGFVDGDFGEWGYFSLDELEDLTMH